MILLGEEGRTFVEPHLFTFNGEQVIYAAEVNDEDGYIDVAVTYPDGRIIFDDPVTPRLERRYGEVVIVQMNDEAKVGSNGE